jgi:hypothetical protein
MNKKNQEELIQFIKSECKKHKIKIDLRKGKYVQCEKGIRSSGYFDSDSREKVLVCAKQNPNFLFVLTHEYCHLTQWKEKCKVWTDYDKSETSILDDWFAGKNFSTKRIKKAIMASLNLELDNEKRTIKVLKRFGMSQAEVDLYIQKSNAYVLFYLYMLETRRWYKTSNVPYENMKVVRSMSKKFNMNYKKLSDKTRKAFVLGNI